MRAPSRPTIGLLLLAGHLAIAPPARAAESGPGVALAPLKALEAAQVAGAPLDGREEAQEALDWTGRRAELQRLASGLAPLRPTSPAEGRRALVTNARCNDPSGDLPSPAVSVDVICEGQSQTAIARWNGKLLAAWNDGKGFDDGTNQTQGWATSIDGGVTWIDQGTLPVPPEYPSWIWMSSPVITVNPNTGAFYLAALAASPGWFRTVGVLKGRFTGGTFTWEANTPSRLGEWAYSVFDKEWLAIDPADGRVYVTYSDFNNTGGGTSNTTSAIVAQWADSSLGTWSDPVVISPPEESKRVQGSRPAVGPDGSVYVVYYLTGPEDLDVYRITRSSDRGLTFAPPHDAISFYPNSGSGAPGFNRAFGIQFPSIAVDRSNHQHAGRVYLAWNESLNWFDDVAGAGLAGTTVEVEPDETPATATPAHAGETIRGFGWDNHDIDYFSIPMQAGQTMLAKVDSLENGETISMRMIAPDGITSLAFLTANSLPILSGTGTPTWIFSAPVAGTYTLRVATVGSFGWYRIRTGLTTRDVERGRDVRDVFVAWSDDLGQTFGTPVRVNQDPIGYDGWLPEVAVAPNGQVGVAWFDWRDAPSSTAGGESNTRLATSSDGGATWTDFGNVSDQRSPWSSVLSNIIPNQGDYLSLFADAQGWVAAWGDGRDLNPNVYMATVPPNLTAAPPAAPAGFALAVLGSPARGSASFAFTLPEAGAARLAIVDLQGRRIRTLHAGALGAGPHTLNWDLLDDDGAPSRAGVYWALLESAGRRAAARVVVLP